MQPLMQPQNPLSHATTYALSHATQNYPRGSLMQPKIGCMRALICSLSCNPKSVAWELSCNHLCSLMQPKITGQALSCCSKCFPNLSHAAQNDPRGSLMPPKWLPNLFLAARNDPRGFHVSCKDGGLRIGRLVWGSNTLVAQERSADLYDIVKSTSIPGSYDVIWIWIGPRHLNM